MAATMYQRDPRAVCLPPSFFLIVLWWWIEENCLCSLTVRVFSSVEQGRQVQRSEMPMVSWIYPEVDRDIPLINDSDGLSNRFQHFEIIAWTRRVSVYNSTPRHVMP